MSFLYYCSFLFYFLMMTFTVLWRPCCICARSTSVGLATAATAVPSDAEPAAPVVVAVVLPLCSVCPNTLPRPGRGW